jgi:hypothetical protein
MKGSTMKLKVLTDRGGSGNGLVIYDGPSAYTSNSIIAIATGWDVASNVKTGPMLQVWILDKAEDPVEAKASGASANVCGSCRHDTLGSCYVRLEQAPLGIWRAWRRGRYPMARPADLDLFKNRQIRLGAYGDPAAVPLSIWVSICGVAASWTAYTHNWTDPQSAGHRRYCMASCDTEAEAIQARAAGWKPFFVRSAAEPLPAWAFACPAAAESGHRLTCDQCLACRGGELRQGQATPSIVVHGTAGKMANFERGIAAAN